MVESVEETHENKKSRIIIVILLILILVSVMVIGYFAMPESKLSNIGSFFESQDEYTILLDEFTTNLYSENRTKSYLKMEIGLMYTDKKEEKYIEANMSKIRDIILEEIRGKTDSELLDVEKTNDLKGEIQESINNSLDKDIIKDIYYTNLIVQ